MSVNTKVRTSLKINASSHYTIIPFCCQLRNKTFQNVVHSSQVIKWKHKLSHYFRCCSLWILDNKYGIGFLWKLESGQWMRQIINQFENDASGTELWKPEIGIWLTDKEKLDSAEVRVMNYCHQPMTEV